MYDDWNDAAGANPAPLFALNKPMSESTNLDFDDVRNAKTALQQLGYYETPSWGLTHYPDEALFGGLRAFQRDQGLTVDGTMRPGGPTETALDGALRQIGRGKDSWDPAAGLLFNLKDEVGQGRANQPDDVAAVQRALGWSGHYGKGHQASGRFDGELDGAIRTAQRELGVTQDGWLAPKGETLAALGQAIRPKIATHFLNALESGGNETPAPEAERPVRLAMAPTPNRASDAVLEGGASGEKPLTKGSVSPEFLDRIWSAEEPNRAPEQRRTGEASKESTEKGKYQINDQTLRDSGWKDANNNWTDKARRNGVGSDEEFRNNVDAQELAAQDVFRRKEESLRGLGLGRYVDRTIEGTVSDFKVTEAGLLAGAHREGEGVVKAYLEHQTKNGWQSRFDNIDPKIAAKFAIYDKSGKLIRTAEDRFRAVETRMRTFEKIGR